MPSYLLDTNHCSRLLQGDRDMVQRLTELDAATVATSVIVRGELVFMVEKSERKIANFRRLETMLARLTMYSIDTDTADWYGTLKAALLDRFGPKEKSKRRKIKIEAIGVTENDLWIAATAKRHGAIIVSADRDFERIAAITDLVREYWWSPATNGSAEP
ncbi:MAG: type II toxin-antitoxin system VapC family toxin [Chloroflexaceae bacterium]|nr:type II toxin-antitoxin system VapC family toxin [Chloroflexaceae bacterium]